MWDLSCLDWEERIREGRSLIPELPLNQDEAAMGLSFFDELPLPDGLDDMKFRDAAGPWFRDLVRAAFGSWDPVNRVRSIRDILTLAPKGSSKTTYSAGLMLTVMLMNKRRNVEALFIGPTQAISDRAYDQAAAMIRMSPDLRRRFDPKDHNKTIVDLVTQSEMKVKTFDLNILTGSILIFVLLDELHLLGRNPHTTKVLRQIRGGLDKTPEGLLLVTTTQSDDIPAGAFKDELQFARKIRDGKYRGRIIRPMLPVLYEFPEDIAKDKAKWGDPDNWPMVMPNLGRSVHMRDLVPDWNSEQEKGEHAIRIWASQHLNIEIGIGLKSDAWPGAEFWEAAEDSTISLDAILERCEVIVVGADGGGRDDIFGLSVLGRERGTKHWLAWSHAWCHPSVLERRQTISARLEGFKKAGELTIIGDELVNLADTVSLIDGAEEFLLPQDIAEIVGIIWRIKERGLLACVAVDSEGPYGDLVDALAMIDVTQDGKQIEGVGQGIRLMSAIKTAERKLSNKILRVAASGLMRWCVQNIKIEPTATAIRATKQNAGDAKIDPAMALFDAVSVMVRNPEPAGQSFWESEDFYDTEEPAAA